MPSQEEINYAEERRRDAVSKAISDLQADARVCDNRMENIDHRFGFFEKNLEERYKNYSELLEKKVSKESFLPVRLLTYGMAACLLLAIIGKMAESVMTH